APVEHAYGTANPFPALGETEDYEGATGMHAGDLTMGADHPVSVTFGSEGAGHQNSVGWYQVGPNGEIQNPQLLWQNASQPNSGGNLAAGTTASLGTVAGAIGFFIVANGFAENDGYGDFDFANGSLQFLN